MEVPKILSQIEKIFPYGKGSVFALNEKECKANDHPGTNNAAGCRRLKRVCGCKIVPRK